MGKSHRKWRESVPTQTVIDAINTMPIEKLIPVAKQICHSDYAVRFYNNKNHPKFYHNDEAFRKAIRRCVAMDAFDHRDTIIRALGLKNDAEND